jgi:hypothetical protein
MAMQYDVKSYHNTVSGVSVPFRTRLKGVIISPSSSTTLNVSFCDNVAQTGTYARTSPSTTLTVTIANHGLVNNQRVALSFTTGTAVSDVYSATVVDANTFTVTTAASTTTSGNVTMYATVLAEFDCSTATSFYTLIPGEGVLAKNGIYMFSPSDTVTSTIFYG